MINKYKKFNESVDSDEKIAKIRNILAYLFTCFTTFTVSNDGTNSVKSYTKRNKDFYDALSNTSHSSLFKQALAMLQTYSVSKKCKGFEDTSNLAKDVEYFIKYLGQNSKSFEVFISLIYNYDDFKQHLLSVTASYNKYVKKQAIKAFFNKNDADIVNMKSLIAFVVKDTFDEVIVPVLASDVIVSDTVQDL